MWNTRKVVIVTICTVIFLGFTGSQLVNPTKRYCFNFSWLGPKFTNESVYNNATCEDVTKLSNNIPCREPLVVTDDGTYPNISYLWENHDAEVTCLLASNEVCASYTYKFDGQFENITYMCTKVVEDTGKSVTSGCYTNYDGNREIEICVCRSNPGFPCNSAKANSVARTLVIFCIIFIISMLNTHS